MDEWFTFIILTCDECKNNILTSSHFESMYKAEQKIKNLDDYENFCVASTQSSDCA